MSRVKRPPPTAQPQEQPAIEMVPLSDGKRVNNYPILFLLDFDETFFNGVQYDEEYKNNPSLSGDFNALVPGHMIPPREDYWRLNFSMQKLLKLCCEMGQVRVVSTGDRRWLRAALLPYLGSPKLREVRVFSSRRDYQLGFDPCKLPLFRKLIREARYRQVLVVGDGDDEIDAAGELQRTMSIPIESYRIDAFKLKNPWPCEDRGYMTAEELIACHDDIAKWIKQVAIPTEVATYSYPETNKSPSPWLKKRQVNPRVRFRLPPE